METVIHPPKTLMEVFKGLPEGTFVQLIENELIYVTRAKRKSPKSTGQDI